MATNASTKAAIQMAAGRPARERHPDHEREREAEVVDDALVVERHVCAPELAHDDARERERRNGEEGRVLAKPAGCKRDRDRSERDEEEQHAVVVLERGAVEPPRIEEPTAHRPPERADLKPHMADHPHTEHEHGAPA